MHPRSENLARAKRRASLAVHLGLKVEAHEGQNCCPTKGWSGRARSRSSVPRHPSPLNPVLSRPRWWNNMESSFEGQAAVTALAFLAGGKAWNRLALLPGRTARLHHASTLALRTWPRPSAVPASAESWHGHAAVDETTPCHRMDVSRLRKPRLSRRLLPGRKRRMETPRPVPGPTGLFASYDAPSL